MSARIGERVMDGIKLLLLLVASAQVEAGTERDYGWAVNKEDGVLEYIVQINPDKKRAMEQRSVQFPNGQENVSNMPRELVGRASRVVIRFGSEILPREPSLQELERTQRLYEQPGVSAAAMLGPGRLQDIESPGPIRDIQGQGSAPVFPAIPSELSGAADGLGQTANALRNELGGRLSDAMPNLNLPDTNTLAQNMANQLGGAGAFLNDARGGGSNSKFNSTAPAASVPVASAPAASAPVASAPASNGALANIPTNPPGNNTASVFPNSSQPLTNNSSSRNQGVGQGVGLGANNAPPPPYPDRITPPSLNTQPSIPQQRTPSSTFGTSPGLAGSPHDWSATNPTNSYPANMSQPNDRYNYGGQQNVPSSYSTAPNPNTYSNPTLVASNNTPFAPQLNNSNLTGGQANSGGLSRKELEDALAVREKFDKNKDGKLTPDEYTPASVDGVILTLFVVSMLVNLYMGHILRKLLMRYRLVLTNVRSQAAYT